MPPSRAASVVLALPAVAIRMPTKPASALSVAPKRYAKVPHGHPQSSRVLMSTAMTTTKTATHVYSRRRNAMAPSRMAAMSSRIRSFPAGAATTWRAKKTASTRPATAATTAIYAQAIGSTENHSRVGEKPERFYSRVNSHPTLRRSGPPAASRPTAPLPPRRTRFRSRPAPRACPLRAAARERAARPRPPRATTRRLEPHHGGATCR